MGHEIRIIKCEYGKTYSEHQKAKQDLYEEANYICERDGEYHHGLYGTPQWHDVELDSREKAEEYLNRYLDCDGGHGCIYREYEKVDNKKSESLHKKYLEINEKVDNMVKDFYRYGNSVDIKNHKSAYIGCPNCGSKINKEYLKLLVYDNYDFKSNIKIYHCQQECPACKTNLLSPTIQARIAKYNKDITTLSEQRKQLVKDMEEAKKTKNYKLMLMLQFEYHV